ncbi:quinolinate synthase NadA [Papillibacter cinnamivorans]|uniref:Quinolinate synthase n=1 Tax=Papillibacter cinnamivorans DSM 12816 TaxID=1122930 RepID=A0A1W1ZE04_9FIRM|nr:quinolinate synthase NadA [Papillibacter cinnamivorans]SMC46422.1 quinolinate synthetase [Papillibacter cinnamivorans DSM 12816]
MNETQKRILALKAEKGALILAHYYQTMDIQEIADIVGDSFELAKQAKAAGQQIIVLCGVKFMAESAKILNPGKTVLLPVLDAGCPMADMITPDDVLRLRKEHPDAAVVCYINSSAAVKAVSDICCTSSSAVRVVRSLPQKKIVFIPDKNLGAYVASQVPEKEFVFYNGFCPVHNGVTLRDVLAAKEAHPGAKVLVHPECRPEVLSHADYIGSTKGILEYAAASGADEFVIGTEKGVAERLGSLAPDKRYYVMTDRFTCSDMKKTRLSDVLRCLETGTYEIQMTPEEISAAYQSLDRMIRVP